MGIFHYICYGRVAQREEQFSRDYFDEEVSLQSHCLGSCSTTYAIANLQVVRVAIVVLWNAVLYIRSSYHPHCPTS